MENKKILIRIINLILIFSIVYYYTGRYEWNIPSDIKLFFYVFLLQMFLNIGYYFGSNINFTYGDNNNAVLKNIIIVRDMQLINKVLSIGCISLIIFQLLWVYTLFDTISIISIFQNIGNNYYDRLSFSIEGSVFLMQVRTLLWGITLFVYPIGFMYFKQVKKYAKILFVMTIIIDALVSLNMGISKNLGDIFLIYLCCICLSEKQNRFKGFLKVIMYFAVFTMIFNIIQTARIEATISNDIYNPFYKFASVRENTIYDYILGSSLSSIIDKMGVYLSHGYTGLAYSLELPFENTYGIGFSRALMQYCNDYLNIDVMDMTYPARIESIYGWPNGIYWPSAYSWFASSISFYGLPIFMCLFGWFFGCVEKRYIKCKDIYSLSMLCQLFIMCVYLPANAQLFQSRASFIGIVELFLIYLATNKRVHYDKQKK